MQSIYFVEIAHNQATGSHRPGRMRAATIGSSVVLAVITLALVLGAEGAYSQSAAQSKRTEASSENAENGRRLYVRYGCYECHSSSRTRLDGERSRIGPDPFRLRRSSHTCVTPAAICLRIPTKGCQIKNCPTYTHSSSHCRTLLT